VAFGAVVGVNGFAIGGQSVGGGEGERERRRDYKQ
jgi:hypothetical protein